MPRKVDISGKQYGRLTAVEFVGRSKTGMAIWLCKCDCGNEKDVLLGSLTTGSTKSCGCLKQEIAQTVYRKYSREDSTWRQLWKTHRLAAKKRELIHMSFKDYKQWLINNPDCWYCGDEPSARDSYSGDTVYAHGIDRIDSSKGYIKGNIRTACRQCNTGKMSYSEEEFIGMCYKVVAKHPLPRPQ